MARKGNPISVRLDLNRSSDSSWFSDYYYGKLVYQDVNLRSYFGSIRPPTRLTFGFRLGRCIILHFPKSTFIHFFLPRRPLRLKRRDKSRPGKEKGRRARPNLSRPKGRSEWLWAEELNSYAIYARYMVGPTGRVNGAMPFTTYISWARPRSSRGVKLRSRSGGVRITTRPNAPLERSCYLRPSNRLNDDWTDGRERLYLLRQIARQFELGRERGTTLCDYSIATWAFGKVGPIGCLHSSEEEERNEVGERVESIRLDDREKQNEIRIWPKKMQRYGYHDRSPSRKKNFSKELRVSGAHPKYAGDDIAFLIASRKTLLFKFFLPKKSRSDGPTSHLLKRTLPAVRPSFNYSVMQYLLNTKNKIHFDPVIVLNHFVAPGVAEPSTMGGRKEGPRSRREKRIRSRIAFFVESSTSEKKCVAQANEKRLIHFILKANDLRFAGTTFTLISLFPFFGATFFFPRDGVGMYKNFFFEYAREQLLGQLRIKCWNLMGKDKVMELLDKFIDLGGIGELIKGIEIMIEIILRKRRIPYGYNSYLNEVQKMRSFLSNRTNTNTLIESVKIKSLYQSASLIAQDISFKLRNNSFRSIYCKIVKDIPLIMPKGVEGIRICCSGRLGGAEIARTECGKYGKTSCNVFNQKIDYASAEVSTRYGILGVKVWISYSQNKKGRAISETYEI